MSHKAQAETPGKPVEQEGSVANNEQMYAFEVNLRNVGVDMQPLRDYLQQCEVPFEPSQLYSSKEKRKFTDTSLRQSEFRALVDDRLFSLASDIVKAISNEGNNPMGLEFELVRNDCTHIRYREGGFFKRHADYLSANGNIIEEYTLLLCVSQPEDAQRCASTSTVGGETVIHWGSGTSTTFQATTLADHALLFRKDLEHEGKVIKSGNKEILSLNVWGFRKEVDPSNARVLHVRFPEDEHSMVQNSRFRKAIAQKSYVIPCKQLTGMLRALADRWSKPGRVVAYDCKVCTYEEFDVVYKVIMRQHIGHAELRAVDANLFAFFQLDVLHILVDLAADQVETGSTSPAHKIPKDADSDNEEEETIAARVFGSLEAVSAELDPSNAGENALEERFLSSSDPGDHIIMCESFERATVVSEIAKQMQLPYVRFRIVFVEGEYCWPDNDGDRHGAQMGTAYKIPLNPVWVSLGDYDNIFRYCPMRKILDSTAQGGDHLFTDAPAVLTTDGYIKMWKHLKRPGLKQVYQPGERGVFVSEGRRSEQWEAEKDFAPIEMLEVAPENVGDAIQAMLINGKKPTIYGTNGNFFNEKPQEDVESRYVGFGPKEVPVGSIFLPGNGTSDAPSTSGLFHIDNDGKTCFSKDEAARATAFLGRIGLIELVKENIQKMRFQLPQQSVTHTIDQHFCNENVYSTFNALEVNGVVRLDDASTFSNEQYMQDLFDGPNSVFVRRTNPDRAYGLFALLGGAGRGGEMLPRKAADRLSVFPTSEQARRVHTDIMEKISENNEDSD